MLPYCLLLDDTLPAKTLEGLKAIANVVSARNNPTPDFLSKVTAAVASPMRGFNDSWFERLPALKVISVFGVGTDKINLVEARARNIDVATTLDILTRDVTDMAYALLLSLTRRIVEGDAMIRAGHWAAGQRLPLGTSLRNKRLGIVGLGAIGRDIAERGAAFGMQPRYYNRSPKQNTSWPHFNSVEELAADSDILAIAISATPETEKLINQKVLDALGSDGIIVNIARGAVIDEDALIKALDEKRIAGAALDVFLNEPRINPAFFKLPNVVLAPHQGSATLETRLAMGQCVIDNIKAIHDGKPALTVVN